jgi:hypothetical protein
MLAPDAAAAVVTTTLLTSSGRCNCSLVSRKECLIFTVNVASSSINCFLSALQKRRPCPHIVLRMVVAILCFFVLSFVLLYSNAYFSIKDLYALNPSERRPLLPIHTSNSLGRLQRLLLLLLLVTKLSAIVESLSPLPLLLVASVDVVVDVVVSTVVVDAICFYLIDLNNILLFLPLIGHRGKNYDIT